MNGSEFWAIAVTPSASSPLDVEAHPHRVAQVLARRSAEIAAQVKYHSPTRALSRGLESTRLTTAASRPAPQANTKRRPLAMPRSMRRGRKSSASPSRCSVASTTSFGIPSVRQTTLVEPPGQHRDRDAGAGEAVGDLVQRAVAAEGDDDVVAAVAGLAADLDRVVLRLGVDRLDVVAALERVDDEVLEPVGDRRRVRVDDDQHPLLGRARRCRSARRRRLGAGRRWRLVGSLTGAANPRRAAGYSRPRRSPRSAPRRRRRPRARGPR